jgi:hypothetical protein
LSLFLDLCFYFRCLSLSSHLYILFHIGEYVRKETSRKTKT